MFPKPHRPVSTGFPPASAGQPGRPRFGTRLTDKLREPLSGLTHCLGALMAAAAAAALCLRARTPLELAAYLVFGAGMVGLYTASTLYHWLPVSPEAQRRLRRIDHSMIFIYIAATYTPICAVALGTPLGWTVLWLIWSLALLGVILKIFWLEAPRRLSTALYVIMGWIALGVLPPLTRAIGLSGVLWLLGGGLMYTAGAVIYALKRPNMGPLGFHEIFHLFVIAGSACHFWTIYRYIAA